MTPSIDVLRLAQAISALAFAGYGVHCLASDQMKREFVRYGLGRFRALTGTLQLAGSAGLLLGFVIPPLVLPSAAGLALLMLCGVYIRLAIRDPLPAAVPAFTLLVLNTVIAGAAYRGLL